MKINRHIPKVVLFFFFSPVPFTFSPQTSHAHAGSVATADQQLPSRAEEKDVCGGVGDGGVRECRMTRPDSTYSFSFRFIFVFFFLSGMFKEGGSRVSRKGSCTVIIANNELWPRPIMTIHRARRTIDARLPLSDQHPVGRTFIIF